VAERLVAAGADVAARDVFGDTPLHTAAMRGKVGVMGALTGHGAPLGLPNGEGLTPLGVAQRHGQKSAAAKLETLGAPPSPG
jgi:ankyrin repeat protein